MITKIYGYYNEHDYGRTSVNRNLSSLHDENGNFVPTSVIKNILERFDTKDIFFELENDKYMKAYMNSNFRCIGTESIGYIEPGDRFMISFDEEHIVVKEDCDEYDGVSRKRVVMNFKNLGKSEETIETEKVNTNEDKIDKFLFKYFDNYFRGYKNVKIYESFYFETKKLIPDIFAISDDDEEILIVEGKYNNKDYKGTVSQLMCYQECFRSMYPDKIIRLVLFSNEKSSFIKKVCKGMNYIPRVKFEYIVYKYVPAHLVTEVF